MATCSYLLNHVQIKGWSSRIRISKHGNPTNINFPTCQESFKRSSERHPKCSLCLVEAGASPDINAVSKVVGTDMPDTTHAVSNLINNLVVADLDPATAKLAIGFLGPLFSLFSFLFIARIVMSWYPKLPVGKFPYVIAYAPTEPILTATRKLIPPLGGVDVTPVVWFGLVSFLNEILVGPQGLLVLLSQQVG